MISIRTWGAVLSLMVFMGCGGDENNAAGLSCGPGTTPNNGQCVPACGAGTVFDAASQTCVVAGAGGSSSAGAGGSNGSSGASGSSASGGVAGTGGTNSCASGANDDADLDGFSPAQGDCNDCDASVFPGAVDLSGGAADGVDNDCDQAIDEDSLPCDQNIGLDNSDPISAAKVLGLCTVASNPDEWGVVSAAWVLPDGSAAPAAQLAAFHLGHGLLDRFGTHVVPQEGTALVALSTGTARTPDEPGYQQGYDKGYSCSVDAPAKLPGSCSSTSAPGEYFDGIALQLEVRVPKNAVGFRFDSKFYTNEWPIVSCSPYLDVLRVKQSPAPIGAGEGGNILFDASGAPFSQYSAFDVCSCSNGPPCASTGALSSCSLGTSELDGTGIPSQNNGAGTAWMRTSAPVQPGSVVSLSFSIADGADGLLDSVILLDNWQWITDGVVTVSTAPVASPLRGRAAKGRAEYRSARPRGGSGNRVDQPGPGPSLAPFSPGYRYIAM